MIWGLYRLALAVFSFFYSEPTESQIDSMLNRAFGLKSNVTYSVSNNNLIASGDVSGSERAYIDTQGNLHVVDIDSEFKVSNNYLYEVE